MEVYLVSVHLSWPVYHWQGWDAFCALGILKNSVQRYLSSSFSTKNWSFNWFSLSLLSNGERCLSFRELGLPLLTASWLMWFPDPNVMAAPQLPQCHYFLSPTGSFCSFLIIFFFPISLPPGLVWSKFVSWTRVPWQLIITCWIHEVIELWLSSSSWNIDINLRLSPQPPCHPHLSSPPPVSPPSCFLTLALLSITSLSITPFLKFPFMYQRIPPSLLCLVCFSGDGWDQRDSRIWGMGGGGREGVNRLPQPS